MKQHKCVPWRGRGGKIGCCIYCGKTMTTKEQVNAFITSCEKCGQDKKVIIERLKFLRHPPIS